MKVDIQKYIQGCLQCQLRKLMKVKTKNPMVITDTPTTAFNCFSTIKTRGPDAYKNLILSSHSQILRSQCDLIADMLDIMN